MDIMTEEIAVQDYVEIVEQVCDLLMAQANPVHAALASVGAAIAVIEKLAGKENAVKLIRAIADASNAHP